MTSPIDKVQMGLQKLKQTPETEQNIAERDQQLKKLKSDLTFFNNLPPTLFGDPDPKECVLASNPPFSFILKLFSLLGEVYEYAVFMSVEKKNIEEFERNMAIIKTYYEEFK